LPTSKPKIVVNGQEVPPINKRKLPPKVDWQAKIGEKKAEVAKVEVAKADEP